MWSNTTTWEQRSQLHKHVGRCRHVDFQQVYHQLFFLSLHLGFSLKCCPKLSTLIHCWFFLSGVSFWIETELNWNWLYLSMSLLLCVNKNAPMVTVHVLYPYTVLYIRIVYFTLYHLFVATLTLSDAALTLLLPAVPHCGTYKGFLFLFNLTQSTLMGGHSAAFVA